MNKWQYLIYFIGAKSRDEMDKMEVEINQLGLAGWEAIGGFERIANAPCLLFKKKIE